MRTLILMRHAQAVETMPGHPDADRPLTERGHDQARRAGNRLRSLVDDHAVVLCSPAVRTRETAEGLGLGVEPRFEQVIYQAGADTLAELITTVDDEVASVVVLGHAPGIPGLVHDLTDPDTADADAIALLDRGFPTATVCRFRLEGSWSSLYEAVLTDTWHHR